MPEVKPEGYYYGVLDLYIAKMTEEDTAAKAPVYEDPKVLAKTIEVTVTPNYKEGKVYASNVTTRSEKRIDTYTVSINPDKIPYAIRQELLGRKLDKNGVQVVHGTQTAPYVALMFAMTLDDDTQELWCLYKGKFAESAQTAHTDADTIQYQHPTFEGTFVRRANDNALAAIANSADEENGAKLLESWFTKVYEPDSAISGGA